ncbi:hypothetical protein [Paenibacillus sinopodophylli]|uniref:hypothetical protein n=1 Tax=Paenibacillus sinopodophylli TaxID=1837342 RepID=UPI00110CCB76|nr:hypothetical protein [Paenibacillus sinopodophylli]
MNYIIGLLTAVCLLTGCTNEPTNGNMQPNHSFTTKPILTAQPTNISSEKLMIYTQPIEADHDTDSSPLIITNPDIIQVVRQAFEHAKPLNDITKLTAASHTLILDSLEYDLWIDDGKVGYMAKHADKNNVYTISTSATFKLREIVSWIESPAATQGLIMDKRIVDTDSYRFLVADGKTSSILDPSTLDRIMTDAQKDHKLAWYTIDKELYTQAHIGQQVEQIAASMQLDSLPPIRFSIATRLIEPLINDSILYLKLVENVFGEQIRLIPFEAEREWILNGTAPNRYTLEHATEEKNSEHAEQLSVYIFQSDEDLEAGLADFHKQTALMDMNYPVISRINNVMLFYWASPSSDTHAEMNALVQEAVEALKLRI